MISNVCQNVPWKYQFKSSSSSLASSPSSSPSPPGGRSTRRARACAVRTELRFISVSGTSHPIWKDQLTITSGQFGEKIRKRVVLRKMLCKMPKLEPSTGARRLGRCSSQTTTCQTRTTLTSATTSTTTCPASTTTTNLILLTRRPMFKAYIIVSCPYRYCLKHLQNWSNCPSWRTSRCEGLLTEGTSNFPLVQLYNCIPGVNPKKGRLFSSLRTLQTSNNSQNSSH